MSCAAEEELALHLCGTAARREDNRARIRALAATVDWQRLESVLARQRVVALAGMRLGRVAADLTPAGFREAVERATAFNRRRSVVLDHLTSVACIELQEAGVRAVPLKGTTLAESAYGDLGLRSAPSDIDLLVRPNQMRPAVAALSAAGWRSYDDVNWGGGLPHYHAGLVRSEPFEVGLEVHWRIHWYETELTDELLAASRPDQRYGRRLSPVSELLTLLLTFVRDGYLGLRLGADIAAWSDRNGADVGPAPLDGHLVRSPRLRDALLAGALTAERDFGVPRGALISWAWSPSRRVRAATRLANWSLAGRASDMATNITLNDLLLTPRGAYRTFLRHYYFQPMEKYRRDYGWRRDNRLRNELRRLGHAAGRLALSGWRYGRRLRDIRGDHHWAPLPDPDGGARAPAADSSRQRLLVVSPIRNEERHLERVARAMAAQTRPPDLWLVADDSSTDGTPELLRRLEPDIPFMRVVQVPRSDGAAGDRLAQALEARAFNAALGQVDTGEYTHIAKLDGDMELPPRYFERLLGEFAADERLGIAGGAIEEQTGLGGHWRRVRVPAYHVHGALKLYSKRCFEEVGGVWNRLGWDTIDETYARLRGYTTRSYPDLLVRHHRPAGGGGGLLRGRARAGLCAYIVRYGPAWVLLRSAKMALMRPYGMSGAAFLYGYAAASLRSAPRVEDEAFKRFTQAELRGRLRSVLPRRASGPRVHLAASAGGHLELLDSVSAAFADCKRTWIAAPGSRSHALERDGERVLYLPLLDGARQRVANLFKSVLLAVRERPRLVVTSGAGAMAAFAVMARLLGARLVFIETTARVTGPSAAGAVLSRLSSETMVQWPEMRAVYPRARLCRPPMWEHRRNGHVDRAAHGVFVAVGSHTDPFDRLLKMVDDAVEEGVLAGPLRSQTGFCRYRPRNFDANPWLSPAEIDDAVERSRYVICHGGSGILASALRAGRRPLVVARRSERGEHVDDHQLQLVGKLIHLGLAVPVHGRIGPSELAEADEPLPEISSLVEGDSMIDALRATWTRS